MKTRAWAAVNYLGEINTACIGFTKTVATVALEEYFNENWERLWRLGWKIKEVSVKVVEE